MTIEQLEQLTKKELLEMARSLEVESPTTLNKEGLIHSIITSLNKSNSNAIPDIKAGNKSVSNEVSHNPSSKKDISGKVPVADLKLSKESLQQKNSATLNNSSSNRANNTPSVEETDSSIPVSGSRVASPSTSINPVLNPSSMTSNERTGDLEGESTINTVPQPPIIALKRRGRKPKSALINPTSTNGTTLINSVNPSGSTEAQVDSTILSSSATSSGATSSGATFSGTNFSNATSSTTSEVAPKRRGRKPKSALINPTLTHSPTHSPSDPSFVNNAGISNESKLDASFPSLSTPSLSTPSLSSSEVTPKRRGRKPKSALINTTSIINPSNVNLDNRINTSTEANINASIPSASISSSGAPTPSVSEVTPKRRGRKPKSALGFNQPPSNLNNYTNTEISGISKNELGDLIDPIDKESPAIAINSDRTILDNLYLNDQFSPKSDSNNRLNDQKDHPLLSETTASRNGSSNGTYSTKSDPSLHPLFSEGSSQRGSENGSVFVGTERNGFPGQLNGKSLSQQMLDSKNNSQKPEKRSGYIRNNRDLDEDLDIEDLLTKAGAFPGSPAPLNGLEHGEFGKLFGTNGKIGTTPSTNGHSSRYIKDRLVAMVVHPCWLHCYWELTSQSMQRAEAALGPDWHSAKMVLRLLDVSAHDTTSTAERILRDVEIQANSHHWYIQVSQPPRSYRIDIGYLTKRGRFFAISRSEMITTPKAEEVEGIESEWYHEEHNADRILAMSGGFDSVKVNQNQDLKRFFDERFRKPAASSATTGTSPVSISTTGNLLPFEITAELMIYGRTIPGAKITLQGEPLPVDAQGFYSMRYTLPDGRQIIPAVATSSDGNEERTIILAVERNTKQLYPLNHDSTLETN